MILTFGAHTLGERDAPATPRQSYSVQKEGNTGISAYLEAVPLQKWRRISGANADQSHKNLPVQFCHCQKVVVTK